MRSVQNTEQFARPEAQHDTIAAPRQWQVHVPSIVPSARYPGLQYSPAAGTILMCDFDGYRDDEIGRKHRPVIVVTTPLHSDSLIATVVPVSQTRHRATTGDVFLEAALYPCFSPDREHWAKVRLLSHVSVKRLDRVLVRGRPTTISLHANDLDRVLTALRALFSTKNLPPDLISQRPAGDLSGSFAAPDWVRAGG